MLHVPEVDVFQSAL